MPLLWSIRCNRCLVELAQGRVLRTGRAHDARRGAGPVRTRRLVAQTDFLAAAFELLRALQRRGIRGAGPHFGVENALRAEIEAHDERSGQLRVRTEDEARGLRDDGHLELARRIGHAELR